jgi:hypothetical protein
MLHIPVPCFGVETDPADRLETYSGAVSHRLEKYSGAVSHRLEKYSGAVSPLAASMCLDWACTTAVFCGFINHVACMLRDLLKLS